MMNRTNFSFTYTIRSSPSKTTNIWQSPDLFILTFNKVLQNLKQSDSCELLWNVSVFISMLHLSRILSSQSNLYLDCVLLRWTHSKMFRIQRANLLENESREESVSHWSKIIRWLGLFAKQLLRSIAECY